MHKISKTDLTRIAGKRVVASVSGGKQIELFRAPGEPGCMRWGAM